MYSRRADVTIETANGDKINNTQAMSIKRKPTRADV